MKFRISLIISATSAASLLELSVMRLKLLLLLDVFAPRVSEWEEDAFACLVVVVFSSPLFNHSVPRHFWKVETHQEGGV